MTILTDVMFSEADVALASLPPYLISRGKIYDVSTGAGYVTLDTVHTIDVVAGRSRISSN